MADKDQFTFGDDEDSLHIDPAEQAELPDPAFQDDDQAEPAGEEEEGLLIPRFADEEDSSEAEPEVEGDSELPAPGFEDDESPLLAESEESPSLPEPSFFDDDEEDGLQEQGDLLSSYAQDDDDFPETDLDGIDDPLSADQETDDVFSESLLSASFSAPEDEMESLPGEDFAVQDKGAGASKTRIALMILLLIVAGGAGIFYFMDLGGTTTAVPTVVIPAQQSSQSVALPAPPVQEVSPPTAAEPAQAPVVAQESVTAAPAEVTPQASSGAAVAQTEEPAAPQAASQAAAVAQTEEPAAPQAASQAAAPAVEPGAEQPVVAATDAAAPAATEAAVQLAGGAYTLDAGSYLMEANRDGLVKKIRKLGYEPLVTPINATLDMTRLRLGTFGKDAVQEALASARKIEPGSYSAPAGDLYVIYAGTFLQKSNIDGLSKRFLAEGVKVYPEPVQVTRTLSRIRFGSFASKDEAAAAAARLAEAGLQASVVKFKE